MNNQEQEIINSSNFEQCINEQIRNALSIQNKTQTEKETWEDDVWIPQPLSRTSGTIEIQKSLEEIFPEDQIQNLYCKTSVTKFLAKHPEPKGGHLKTQNIDNQLPVPLDARKLDESWQDIQRAILCTIRPLLTVRNWIEDSVEESEETNKIKSVIKDTIRYVNHVACTVRIQRRIQIARRIGLCPYSDSHYKCGSTDEGQLFGPELRNILEQEKKAAIKTAPKGRFPQPQQSTGRGTRPIYRNQEMLQKFP